MSNIDYSELILCRELRVCEKCKEPTFWMRPKQRSLGHCVSHSVGGNVTTADAFLLIQQTFPDASWSAVAPRRWHRGEYVTDWVRRRVTFRTARGDYVVRGWGLPEDAGPCALCGALIQLYGPDGYPLCAECDEVPKGQT